MFFQKKFIVWIKHIFVQNIFLTMLFFIIKLLSLFVIYTSNFRVFKELHWHFPETTYVSESRRINWFVRIFRATHAVSIRDTSFYAPTITSSVDNTNSLAASLLGDNDNHHRFIPVLHFLLQFEILVLAYFRLIGFSLLVFTYCCCCLRYIFCPSRSLLTKILSFFGGALIL